MTTFVKASHLLVKTEEEWQAIYNTQGWCPFYSDGDGIDTFRMPSAPLYLHGADALSEAGKYIKAGLPNITGVVGELVTGNLINGAFYRTASYQNKTYPLGDYAEGPVAFDASRSSAIYGNSNTVTPETSKMLFGVWAISAPQKPIPDVTAENIISELEIVSNGLNGVVRSVNGVEADMTGNVPRKFISKNVTIAAGNAGIAGTYDLGFTDDKVRIGVFSVTLQLSTSGNSLMELGTDTHTTGVIAACTNNGFKDGGCVTIPFKNQLSIKFPVTTGGVTAGTAVYFEGYFE